VWIWGLPIPYVGLLVVAWLWAVVARRLDRQRSLRREEPVSGEQPPVQVQA
jgi:hypothetical protein